jgi:hypothetical protein
MPPAVGNRADYIDLQPGWRLRVVTPLLKSGGSLSTAADFLGYEVAYYAVRSRNGSRVRVEFLSAEITKEGTTSAQSRPLVPPFQLPRSAKYVRLIFLTRVSRADHDMAMVAAREAAALDALTERVLADPAGTCHSETQIYCVWIPKGIALAPELRTTTSGGAHWIPAR